MLRLLATLVGVLSCTALMAELVGLGYLWSQGSLTNTNLYEVRLILTGETRDEDAGKTDESKAIGASQQELQAARVMRVLDLESRGKELELLKTMTENRANQLILDQKSFDEMKDNFRTELAGLKERTQGEAVDQARAVLLASPTEAAVQRLMDLPVEEAIGIVRGMPEKSIAKILQGFDVPGKTEAAGGAPDERRVRGQKIFEALSRGEPARSLTQDTLSKVPQGAADPPPSGG
jgi:hypothetical protein